jgi:hypothetical protein
MVNPTAGASQNLVSAIINPNKRSPIGPMIAGTIIGYSRYSGSRRPLWNKVPRFEIISRSFPPKKNERVAPMKPEIENRPTKLCS